MARSRNQNSTTGTDLRHSRRHKLPVVVQVRYGELGDAPFEARDLSPDGTFLESDLLFELGDRVNLMVSLPGGYELSVEGEVVRVEVGLAGEGQGMGIAFRNLGDDQRAAIEKVVPRAARPRARFGILPSRLKVTTAP